MKTADYGILSIQMPEAQDSEGDQVSLEVSLGGASEWLAYDQASNTIKKKDQSQAIPAGNYDVTIKLSDDNVQGKAESQWSLQIQVFESLEFKTDKDDSDKFCCRKDYVLPKIQTISTFGELTLKWDKEMLTPKNETLYSEQLLDEV